MNVAIIVAIIGAIVSLAVGVIGPLITINVNRATAVKLLSEASEKIGTENQRMSERIVKQRETIVCLINALDKCIPLLDTDETHKQEVKSQVDKARIHLYS